MKPMSTLVLVYLLVISSFSFTASAKKISQEADRCGERCSGYCLIEFQVESDNFFYYEAQRCKTCASVTLKCSEEHFEAGSECKSCGGTCPGHAYPDCTEVRESEANSSTPN